MTLWRRLLGRRPDPQPGEAAAGSEPVASQAPPAEVPAASPEERLAALADGRATAGADEVLQWIEDLRERGAEARAIDLARRVLRRCPELDPVSLRVAELLAYRGDDAAAAQVLEAVAAKPRAPLQALMLLGEVAERRGDDQQALIYYERVLARDLDFAQARERVRRLREAGPRDAGLAGATLMTDGALARGRYQVERELGRGGAGAVFAASDTELGRHVALKVYHRRGRAERERLVVEGRTPAGLEHPGVIRVFDLDEELGALVMEWVRGGSVRHELRKGAVPIGRVAGWVRSALDALSFVHGRGFVHRDFKPSNLLLREDDSTVLTDFGLAVRIGETPHHVGAGEGTLAYMPPEQRAGAPAHPSTDVYAFGATLRDALAQASGDIAPVWLELAQACQRERPDDRPTIAWLRGHTPLS